MFCQHIEHKRSTLRQLTRQLTTVAEAEEEESDIFDITLLRFLAAFVYVYLAFELVAGIVQVSSGHLGDFYPGWACIVVGLLGIAEVTALLIFLMELKRKVRMETLNFKICCVCEQEDATLDVDFGSAPCL